jgi:hypothetical protein
MFLIESHDSTVSIETGYGLDYQGVEVQVPVWARIFTSHIIQTGSGVHPTSYPMGTVGSFPGGFHGENTVMSVMCLSTSSQKHVTGIFSKVVQSASCHQKMFLENVFHRHLKCLI